MANKKTEKNEIEREYIIPLREKSRVVPRYKKTPKAIKTIKEFIARHMKVENRDLNKVKIDKNLNEFMWAKGIRKHPHKIKVKAIREGENVTWINTGNDRLTLLSDDIPDFGAKLLDNGKRTSYKFTKSGTYTFYLKGKANINGTIVVEP